MSEKLRLQQQALSPPSETVVVTDVAQTENAERYSERLRELRKTFDVLAASTYEGITGVIKIEGKKPGPTIGVTVMTHGDEPGGLAGIEYLLKEIAPHPERLAGTIFVVLNNLRAAEQYFNVQTEDERRKCRFVDENMNRLPDDTLTNTNCPSYEAQRTRELQPVYNQFGVCLDIHSTTQDSEPMIVVLGNMFPRDLVKGMPIKKVISNIDNAMRGKPAVHFTGTVEAPAVAIGIEAGSHENLATFECAAFCTQIALQNLGMIEGGPEKAQQEYEEYHVTTPVMFPDESYELTRLFRNFEFIEAGTVIARGNGPDIVAEEDCHALFASRTKPLFITEEVMFLTKPVLVHRMS